MLVIFFTKAAFPFLSGTAQFRCTLITLRVKKEKT
jgi:hypothetical protein